MVHKSNPIKKFKNVVVHPSEKPITNAIFEKVKEGCQDKPQLIKNSFTNLTEFN
jgi:hypothetical protein